MTSKALVRRGHGTHHAPGTALAKRGTADPENHPVAIYLASLAKNSRPAMLSALDKMAERMQHGSEAYTFPWQGLRFKHTQALRAWLGEEYAPRSINRMICAVRGVMKAAWNNGMISTDDYHRAVQFKYAGTRDLLPSGRRLEIEEIQQLYEACATSDEPRYLRDTALITILYAGGLRREEASYVNVEHYNPKDGELTVAEGKRGKSGVVYIPSAYRHALDPWLTHRGSLEVEPDESGVPLFVSFHRRGPPRRLTKTGVSHAIRELRELAKVKPFTPHDLRRSFGTHLLDSGADILMVQKLMRHANLSTTGIYDRRGEVGKRKAIEFLPKITFPVRK